LPNSKLLEMNKSLADTLKNKLTEFSRQSPSTNMIYRQGHSLYLNGQVIQLLASGDRFEFIVYDRHDDFRVTVANNATAEAQCNCKAAGFCRHRAAAYMQLHEFISTDQENLPATGIKYTRNGMIRRVVEERKTKAAQAKYEIRFADNIYGEHLLTNELNKTYKLTFRDLEKKYGYCTCPDYRTNKLGSCKHLIFAFNRMKSEIKPTPGALPKYPFIEIFLNPFRNYKISWFYPEEVTGEVAEVLYRYFGNRKFIEDHEAEQLIPFFEHAQKYKRLLIRQEVLDKVADISEQQSLQRLQQSIPLTFEKIRHELLPYQKDGVTFATFRKGAMIADEMGMGKTLQAIATAVMKKELLGFRKTLIVCQASMKEQWVKEIKQNTGLDALIVEGAPDKRLQKYEDEDFYFRIAGYETIVRDNKFIHELPFDFLILDEAQRIAGYTSKVFAVLNAIQRKHTLVLTGIAPENDLIALYSLVLLADPYLLSPLWEFSYMHCYFASESNNSITGFYGIDELRKQIENVVIRRKKQDVIRQLPNIGIIDIPVKLHPYQQNMYLKLVKEATEINRKAILSRFDSQRLIQLFEKMRQVTASSFLIDDSTNYSPKLEELRHILLTKLDVKETNQKIVIFTGWKKMANIIARMLRINKIAFADATADEAAKSKEAVKKFESEKLPNILLAVNETGKFLKHEKAGFIINFDIPWLSQHRDFRIGRIDKLGTKEGNISIINLIAGGTFEEILAQNSQAENDAIYQLLDPSTEEKPDKNKVDLINKTIGELSSKLSELLLQTDHDDESIKNTGRQMQLDFTGELPELTDHEAGHEETGDSIKVDKLPQQAHPATMKEVMNNGMNFLSTLIKLTTGDEPKIHAENFVFDEDSGEIIMKFKIPKSK
jgi:superfamily II DNA or RNA helicase